jgi:phosphate transport system protein
MTEHVIKQYEEELRRLRHMVLSMGTLAGEQLDAALAATEHPDTAVASRVVEREPDADRLQHQIDGLVIRLLALRQPVAIDLREIMSALQIANGCSEFATTPRTWQSACWLWAMRLSE